MKDFMFFCCLFVFLYIYAKQGVKTALLTLMRNGCLCRFEVTKTPFTGKRFRDASRYTSKKNRSSFYS